MNSSNPSFFIFAGEKSGDLHGSRLIRALRSIKPELSIAGVAGPDMRQEGVQGPLSMEDFEVMGLSDVIFSLPKLYSQFKTVRSYILENNPSIVVLIDYPGFNLRLAKSLRKKGYRGKIVQYVSPSVWAHGSDRIALMASTLDLLLTIFPFEKKHFASSPLKVVYIGNPLCEYICEYAYENAWKDKLGIRASSHLISLFPGSRINEISRNLPIILAAAEKILINNPEAIFGLSVSDETALKAIRLAVSFCSKSLQEAIYYVPKRYSYELMRDSHTAIAKSGTVTLELALHQCPTVVLYQLTTLNRLYGKYILKLNLPHFCIVNILLGKEVFPELIAKDPTPETLYNSFKHVDTEGMHRQNCIDACKQLRDELTGATTPSKMAANAILNLLSCEVGVC